ncbi:MAG TPA: right-handed parallel beta-helix repeat-containing protein, partial [Nitrososphaeraceae archaeon]
MSPSSVLPLVLTFGQGSSPAAACVSYDIHTNTITVACNSNLSSIYQIVNDKSVLQKDAHGVWILNAIIKVNPQAKLTIDRTDSSWLKITNKNKSQPNFIYIFGSAKIDGVKITSWDLISKDIIKQNVKGSSTRPYIMVNNSAGTVNISNSEIAYLGKNSYPQNGLVYESGGNGSSIINNTFHDMWDGFYSAAVGFITIKNNKYYNNLRYGIDPHTGSHDLSIIGNLAYNNTTIGIICSENCYNILFYDNIVHNNGVAGLMFSLNTINSVGKKNYAYNEKAAFSIYGSSNNRVYDNMLKSSDTGVFIGGNSSHNHIFNNTIVKGKDGIYFNGKQPKDNV